MSAPQAYLHGIDDKSRRAIPYEELPYAQHTPLHMLMTRRGPVEAMLISSDGFDVYYDLASLGEHTTWHTHQSEFTKIAISEGNGTMVVKRIIDEYSKPAFLRAGMEPHRRRIKDVSLDKPVDVYNPNEFLPIFEFETADPGEWGNYIGVEITKATDQVQATVGTAIGCCVYEARVIIEDEHTGSRRIHANKYGELVTLFVLKRHTFYNERDMFFDYVMEDAYIEDSPSSTRRQTFSRFKLFDSSLPLVAGKEDYWSEDILTDIKPVRGQGFRRGLTFFAKGGSDGFPDLYKSDLENSLYRQQRYDELCREWLTSLDDVNPIVDMAKYPFSTLWDSGYTKETKQAMLNLLRLRKDIWIANSVYSQYRYIETPRGKFFDYHPPLSTQEAISLGMYYRAMFGSIPESVLLGTPTVRATLMMQDGINRNSNYKKRQTLNADLFRKVCRYCGSSTKQWNDSNAFDGRDTNLLTGWMDVNATYMPRTIKEQAWNSGLIYVQWRDTQNYFYPAYQTLYPEDDSVLNNIFVMMACCWIQKLHYKAWTRVTGNAKQSIAELAETVDDFLNHATINAFDGRFIVRSKTIVTEADKALGFAFTTETSIYSTITKHTASYKITAHRQTDSV